MTGRWGKMTPKEGPSVTRSRLMTIVTMLTLVSVAIGGCTLFDDSSESGGGESEASTAVAQPEDQPQFANGAVEAWSMDWPEPFPGNQALLVHPSMAVAFGQLVVFGSYGSMVAVNSTTGKILWTVEGVDSVNRCGVDEEKGLLLCPPDMNEESRGHLVVVEVATGMSGRVEISGSTSEAHIGTVQKVDDTLVIYQYDSVLRTDMTGAVIWEQDVLTQETENRYSAVTPTMVQVSEPSAGLLTLLDLESGDVIYSGDNSSAPAVDVVNTSGDGRLRVEDIPWVTDDRFEDGENCLFQLEGAVLYAPNNCQPGDESGTVTAYDAESGDPLWQMAVTGTVLAGASGQDLVTVQGLTRVAAKGFYEYSSITAYRPTKPDEDTTSMPVGSELDSEAAVTVPTGIPDCPGSTIRLSWAQIPEGWVLVCGYSETEPVLWMSQFDGASEVSSSEVSYVLNGGSPAYQAELPTGSVVRVGPGSENVEILENAGDILTASGTMASKIPMIIIYFVNMGTRELMDPATAAAWASQDSGSSSSSERTPAATPNAPAEAAVSSAYCPSGTSPYFEGETEEFFISICRGVSTFYYVGYSPNVGEMVLPSQDEGSRWWASNASHGYAVSSTHLDVYELSSNSNILHQPFVWTRQY